MPTWTKKLTPLARISFSSAGLMPSLIEGVLASSASLNSHCASASARTRLGDLGLSRVAGCVEGRWLVLDGGGIVPLASK